MEEQISEFIKKTSSQVILFYLWAKAVKHYSPEQLSIIRAFLQANFNSFSKEITGVNMTYYPVKLFVESEEILRFSSFGEYLRLVNTILGLSLHEVVLSTSRRVILDGIERNPQVTSSISFIKKELLDKLA